MPSHTKKAINLVGTVLTLEDLQAATEGSTASSVVTIIARDLSNQANDTFAITFVFQPPPAPSIRFIVELQSGTVIFHVDGQMTDEDGTSYTRQNFFATGTKNYVTFPSSISLGIWGTSQDGEGAPGAGFTATVEVSDDQGATWTNVYSAQSEYDGGASRWGTGPGWKHDPAAVISLNAGSYYRFN